MSDIKTKIRRIWYKMKHDICTLNNAMLIFAFFVGVSWIWQSISAMSRNYELQRRVDDLYRTRLILELEVATLKYEQEYYKMPEYQELMAREKLGLAKRGERVLILPENSEEATNRYKDDEFVVSVRDEGAASNFYQWMRFLFGQNNPNR